MEKDLMLFGRKVGSDWCVSRDERPGDTHQLKVEWIKYLKCEHLKAPISRRYALTPGKLIWYCPDCQKTMKWVEDNG